MEGGNVEIVGRLIDAARSYWRGEGPWIDLLGPFFDPQVDYYPVRKWPESRPCHGVEELERFMAAMSEGWHGMDWEIHEVEPVGDDRVLMRASLQTAGRGSGLQLAGDIYVCYWLRGGRVFRQEDHLTEAGARRGLGIDG